MLIAEVRSLFDYTDWANVRCLGAADELTEEQFTRALGSSFSSIRDTIAHILGAEWIWLRRWQGESPSASPSWVNGATRPELNTRRNEVATERAAFLQTLRDSDLQRRIRYRNLAGEWWEYPLENVLVHVVNHSTYHRGQVATLLRQVGAKAPATDLLVFRDQARS